MKKYFALLIVLHLAVMLHATDYSGIYTYNKGINKPNGSLCIFQFKSDSAFFYLNNMSGSPDFFLTNMKGFLRVDSNGFNYRKDSCKMNFAFSANVFSATQNSACKNDFSVEGKYKKVNNTMKRPNTWMAEYTEKSGVVSIDSAIVYFAPHIQSKQLMTLKKDTPVKIIDEMNGFFLVEIPKQKNEFHWINKKNVLLNK